MVALAATPPAPPHYAGLVIFRWGNYAGRAVPLFLLTRSRQHGEWGFPKAKLAVGECSAACAVRAGRAALCGVELALEPAAGVHTLAYSVHTPPAAADQHELRRVALHVACAPAGLRTPDSAAWLPRVAAEVRAGHAEMCELLSSVEREVVALRDAALPAAPPALLPPPPAAAATNEAGAAHLLPTDLLIAILNRSDSQALGACWSVCASWHAAARSITARALDQLDALARGEPVAPSADDLWWLSQLDLKLLRARLLCARARESGALGALAHACYTHGTAPECAPAERACSWPSAGPPPLGTVWHSEAPRMARACVAFAACEAMLAPGAAARELTTVRHEAARTAVAAASSSFVRTLLSRLRADAQARDGGHAKPDGSRLATGREAGGEARTSSDLAPEPANDADAASDRAAPRGRARAPVDAAHLSRFLAQLFAHGFAPWADTRRTLRAFGWLSGALIVDLDSYVSARADAADALGAVRGGGSAAERARAERRVAGERALALCELIAGCAMRLQLEVREAADGATRRALRELLGCTLNHLAGALPEIHERWVAFADGALPPRATAALEALLAFQIDDAWELADGQAGRITLGIPDTRVARYGANC